MPTACSRRQCGKQIPDADVWRHIVSKLPYCPDCARRINYAADASLEFRPIKEPDNVRHMADS